MRNRNAVRLAAQNFVIAIAIMILAGCGQNPGGDYTSSSPILPAVADTVGSSLDLTIPLDVAVAASNPQRFAVRGKYIAIDPGSTGQANLRLNSISDTARLAYPGSTFNPGDFTDLYFDYQAQPGKFLHVLYGDSPDILSAGAQTAINPALPKSTYINNTGNASGNVIIVPAASNVNGIRIYAGKVMANASGIAATGTVYASSYITAGYIGYASTAAAVGGVNSQSDNVLPIYIPPGLSLAWFYSSNGPAVGGTTLSGVILNYEVL